MRDHDLKCDYDLSLHACVRVCSVRARTWGRLQVRACVYVC